ncbi:MAG: hypothetical protein IPL33_22440 [Sphingobacteriales bacterium]|nr:hypothetical protein [Sphingobacteriales bacterium]
MASVFPKLCTLVSHNRRQRPHSRRMPSRVRFCPNFAPRATDAGYGRLCIVGGGFALMRSNFTCYEALNRFTRKFQIPLLFRA